MYEKTYRGVSLLITNYFRLRIAQQPELHGTYDILPEDDKPGKGETYTIALSGEKTYTVMQRIFAEANG
jgi:hypothetical protein